MPSVNRQIGAVQAADLLAIVYHYCRKLKKWCCAGGWWPASRRAGFGRCQKGLGQAWKGKPVVVPPLLGWEAFLPGHLHPWLLVIWLAPSFGKTSRRTLLPLCSSQTPRKKLEKNGALAWPSAKEEVKTGIKKDISQELRWNEEVQFTRNDPDEMCVHGFEWEYPDSMSYFHISDTRGQNERKNAVEQWKSEIINLMTTRLSFCTVWSCFYAVQKDNSLSKSASYIINWSSLCMYKFICILRRVANKKSGSSN